MLKQAVINEISQGRVTKDDGFLVVTTRFYPRFLDRSLVDEYIAQLAPTRELLREFKAAAEKYGHNEAFININYPEKFALSPFGLLELERLALLSKNCDVHLACYCARDQYCHREILLLLAKELFQVETDPVERDYGALSQSAKFDRSKVCARPAESEGKRR